MKLSENSKEQERLVDNLKRSVLYKFIAHIKKDSDKKSITSFQSCHFSDSDNENNSKHE